MWDKSNKKKAKKGSEWAGDVGEEEGDVTLDCGLTDADEKGHGDAAEIGDIEMADAWDWKRKKKKRDAYGYGHQNGERPINGTATEGHNAETNLLTTKKTADSVNWIGIEKEWDGFTNITDRSSLVINALIGWKVRSRSTPPFFLVLFC